MDGLPADVQACAVTAAAYYGLPPEPVVHRIRIAGGKRGEMVSVEGDVLLGVSRLSAQRVRHLVSTSMSWERIANDDCLNVGLSAYTMALDTMQQYAVAPATTLDACVRSAAAHYGVPEPHFRGILAQEGGRSGMRNRNTNGSYDLGVGQINTIHLSELRLYGISEQELIHNDCLNVHVAAYRFRVEIDRVGGDVWRGVGNYHSRTPALSNAYRGKVQRRMREAGFVFSGGAR